MIRWKECMEAKGMRINTGKTKVMVSGKKKSNLEQLGKLPCTVCGKGTGGNSIRCTGCSEWVHKKCSGVKGSLARLVAIFVC